MIIDTIDNLYGNKERMWPELFEKVKSGRKNTDIRLADFDIKKATHLYWKNSTLKLKNIPEGK